jgi:hypothetical protein
MFLVHIICIQSAICPEPNDTAPLATPEIMRIQKITGMLLYYGRACDPTTHVALNNIASTQSKGTEATTKVVTQLINYYVSIQMQQSDIPPQIWYYISTAMLLTC